MLFQNQIRLSSFSVHLLFLGVLCLPMCKNKSEIKNPPLSKENTVGTTQMLPLIHDPVEYLDSIFSAAMLDAQNPEPDEIYTSLTRIQGNDDLVDTIIDQQRHVLMVSWKNNPTYIPSSGKYTTDDSHDIWVTVAPYIKEKCIEYYKNEKDPNMRLRQLLGLQPFTIETAFVELWVKPDQLYRPCPDNETNDTSCELNLPQDVTKEYRTWFNHTRAFQYSDCQDTFFNEWGYPWTQLGYTYDWSPDNPSHVGLSEFVIRRNSEIYIKDKYNTQSYCMNN